VVGVVVVVVVAVVAEEPPQPAMAMASTESRQAAHRDLRFKEVQQFTDA